MATDAALAYIKQHPEILTDTNLNSHLAAVAAVDPQFAAASGADRIAALRRKAAEFYPQSTAAEDLGPFESLLTGLAKGGAGLHQLIANVEGVIPGLQGRSAEFADRAQQLRQLNAPGLAGAIGEGFTTAGPAMAAGLLGGPPAMAVEAGLQHSNEGLLPSAEMAAKSYALGKLGDMAMPYVGKVASYISGKTGNASGLLDWLLKTGWGKTAAQEVAATPAAAAASAEATPASTINPLNISEASTLGGQPRWAPRPKDAWKMATSKSVADAGIGHSTNDVLNSVVGSNRAEAADAAARSLANTTWTTSAPTATPVAIPAGGPPSSSNYILAETERMLKEAAAKKAAAAAAKLAAKSAKAAK